MKSSKQTLTESSFVLVISTILVKIIGALFKIPLAGDTFLGEEGFGYYSVAHDFYTPFYTLAISGLPVAVSHIIADKISQNKETDAHASFTACKKLFVICGIVFSGLLALLTVPALLMSQGGLNSAYSIFVMIPSVFLCFVISVYRGYFEGFFNMYPTAVSKVIEAVCKLVLGLLLSFMVLKITNDTTLAAAAAMLSVTIGTALSTLYLYIKYKRKNPIDISALQVQSTKNNDLGKLFKMSMPFALASLAVSLVAFLDIFTVKLPIDAANSGYFTTVLSQSGKITGDISTYLYGVRSKAFTISNIIPTFTAALGVGALPVLTSLKTKGDLKSLADNVVYLIKLVCTITFPVSLGIFALGDRIMPLLYSYGTVLDANLLKLYAIVGLLTGVAVPLTTILLSIGKNRTAITHIIIGIILKIATSLSLVFIPQINIYSAPIGTIVSYLYIAIAVLISITKNVKARGYITATLKPLFCAILCAVSAYFISQINTKTLVTVLAILVGGVVYLSFVLITRVFKRSELCSIPVLNRLFKAEKQ